MDYINFEHIYKSFDGKEVLKDINISIDKGEFITLLGPSGCGKTTLLRSLAGLEKLDSGAIYLDEKEITYMPPKDRNISMIFQQYSLFPTMTVYKNIAFGLKMKKVDKKEIHQKVMNSLKMVDLLGSESKYPFQLSGGEQQRVALARCIVTDAKVLLLDEPFSAIDAKLRKALQIKIKEIHNDLGITTVFVTHDQEEAMRMSDRIYLMNDGMVEQMGSPMDLYLNPRTPFAVSFMGHYNYLTDLEYTQLVGKRDCAAASYAIRPEIIEMKESPWTEQTSDYDYFEGVIKRITHQGNIVRYSALVGETILDIDVLFEMNHTYLRNSKVYLRTKKDQILLFQS